MKRVVIVGTGISALSLGWFLKETYKDAVYLTFIEKKDKPGGLIQTKKVEDFLFELGPRGFRPSGSGLATLQLTEALGLKEKLIYAHPNAKKRYIYQKGKLKPFSPFFLLQNGLISGCLNDLFFAKRSSEEETVATFVRRRFNQKLLEAAMDPLVTGIYGGDVEKLSMKSCFPYFLNLEKNYGSLLKGLLKSPKTPSTLVSFNEGMQILTDTLAKKIEASFFYSTTIKKIEKKGNAFVLDIGQDVEADRLIFCTQPEELSLFFEVPKLAIERISLTTINLGWKGKKLPVSGFGFLVPSSEKKNMMGMTFDSDIFPDQQKGEITRVTVMSRSHGEEKTLLQQSMEELYALFRLKDFPDAYAVNTHCLAIPQYTIGHDKRVNDFFNSLPAGVSVLGNSYQGVSVNDCILNAKKFVTSLGF